MGKIKRLIKRMIYSFITYERLMEDYNERALKTKAGLLTMGEGTVLYPESTVYNMQKDKTKIVLGKNNHVRGSLNIFGYGGEIKIGEWCYVGDDSRIWSGERVEIGNHVLISHNVFIVDTTSHEMEFDIRAERFITLIQTGAYSTKSTIQTKPIIIKDYAWINPNSVILKGVTIGKGAIVAAGSIVTKDVPDFVLVGGNPATIVKHLDDRRSIAN